MTHLRVIQGDGGLCAHCGGEHSSKAHHDPIVALMEADRELERNRVGDARAWIAVARALVWRLGK